MQRIVPAAMASSLLLLAAPGMASAANHGKRHHARHSSAHTRRATHARVRTFGRTRRGVASVEPPGPAANPPSGESIGTITSFEKTTGVLTITLKDKSTISGQVTEATEIHCGPLAPPPLTGPSQGEGGNAGPYSGANGGPPTPGQPDAAWPGRAEQSGGGEGQSHEQGGDDDDQGCTTAALVTGAEVRGAELNLTGSGAVWEKIDLTQ